MYPKRGSAESTEKTLDNIKSMRDFDHMQRGQQAKIHDKQQPEEQKRAHSRKLKILWLSTLAEAVPVVW